jgi:ArsR family transcriptional regulator
MKLLNPKPAKLSQREERLINAMQALGDKSRFKMFKIMLSGKEMCVSEIAGALEISVPAVSQHFRVFEFVGLVDRQRYGQKICYALKSDDRLVQELIRII